MDCLERAYYDPQDFSFQGTFSNSDRPSGAGTAAPSRSPPSSTTAGGGAQKPGLCSRAASAVPAEVIALALGAAAIASVPYVMKGAGRIARWFDRRAVEKHHARSVQRDT